MRARTLGAAAAAVLMAGALPAAAGAADYCVAPNASCNGGNVGSLELALDLADQLPDADRIFLGAATYTAPTVNGFRYEKPDSPVEIIGQGMGKTVLTTPPGGIGVLKFDAAAGSSVHDLTIRMPENAAPASFGLTTRNLAQRIEVLDHPTQSYAHKGVQVHHGGMLEDSKVTLGKAQKSSAVVLGTGGGTVRRSALSAGQAAYCYEGGSIERSRLTGEDGIITFGGALALTDSVIRFEQDGIAAYADFNTAVVADGVTLAGTGSAGSRGIFVSTKLSPDQPVAVTLVNSVIWSAVSALYVEAPGSGKATVDASYSNYSWIRVASGPGASFSESNVTHVGNAGFVDAAAGDFHLLPESPFVDAGDPATPQGLDLAGNPLVADGDDDGTARRDLGAFELQPAPAPAPGTAPPAAPATGSQPEGTGTSDPGTGSSQAGTGATADVAAPLVSAFRATPSVFAVPRARTGRGTRFRFSLSEPARVRIAIRRVRAGGSRRVARLVRSGSSGANSVRFTGRIGRRALRPGRYRAVLTAVDAAGNRSVRRATRFRIARG